MHCCPNMHFLLNVINNLKRLPIWAGRWIRYVHVETSHSCYIKCLDHISCYFSAHHPVNYRHAHLMLLSSKFHTTLGNCSKCDTQTGGLPLLENSEVCTEICKLSLLSKYTRSPLSMHLLTEYNSPIQSTIPSGNNYVLARASHSLKQEIPVDAYKLPATLLLSFIISWAQDVCRWKLRTMEWSTTCPFYWVRC
jgi:hypothetical protein